jgi:hypothetical protein
MRAPGGREWTLNSLNTMGKMEKCVMSDIYPTGGGKWLMADEEWLSQACLRSSYDPHVSRPWRPETEGFWS